VTLLSARAEGRGEVGAKAVTAVQEGGRGVAVTGSEDRRGGGGCSPREEALVVCGEALVSRRHDTKEKTLWWRAV
jgi:hypothetical protein